VTTSGIPSARKKLERARTHLDALDQAVDEFREQSPYEFTTRTPGNKKGSSDIWVTVTVAEAPPIPDSWALITGDILTNARGALDHAVFPHIRARKPTLERKYIQYPIEDSKEQWNKNMVWHREVVHRIVGDYQVSVFAMFTSSRRTRSGWTADSDTRYGCDSTTTLRTSLLNHLTSSRLSRPRCSSRRWCQAPPWRARIYSSISP
jgi:hypothetical protein